MLDIGAKIMPYLIDLAESPAVQADVESAKAAIISIVEEESIKAMPLIYQVFTRFMRWIIKKITGDVKNMNGIVNITVQNSAGAFLSGAAVSYDVAGAGAVSATSDANGLVSVSDLPAGAYTFTASLAGYTAASANVTAVDDTTVTGVITMTATVSVGALLTALVPQVSTVVTNSSTEAVNTLIAKLEAEMGTGSSVWVDKIRDPLEVALLQAIQSVLVTALTNNITAELEALIAKI
jgi:hypothetical protein